MVRIDFMVTKNVKIYLTEINPIPGSMAFYLWEASGVTFTQQITDSIEQSIKDFEYHQSLKLDYGSDIVEKFVGS
jgi:D-alanine-D-alanine ligase